MSKQSWFHRVWASFSYFGLVLGTLFFSASLSPSLLPRNYMVQGVLSGLALAIGYGFGILMLILWRYMELAQPQGRVERIAKCFTTISVVIIAAFSLWRATIWQNSIRELMEMPPLAGVYAPYVALISLVVGTIVVGCSLAIGRVFGFVKQQLNRVLPGRVSNVLSAFIVAILVLMVANKVVAKYALTLADAAYLKIDAMVDEDMEQPTDPMASGSEQSLVDWDLIGKRGKDFVLTGPTRAEISEVTGKPAKQPLRVYVGLGSRNTPQQRAKLALDELKRVGGFERSVLVVATPTGTGWLHPAAVDPLEYLHGGDTAIVSIQYSYLPSFITILVDPERSITSARCLFDEIYGYWRTLPKETRPKLYLHGLSLGSLGSESCADLFTLFENPIQGGVWSGPPFPSASWSELTRSRNPDSPAWLPTFRDGAMVRFTARENALNQVGERWGPMRFVYIQHASDPITFFEPSLFYRKPAWLTGQRGPDVSPYLQWFPIVTGLQIGFDLSMAGSVPDGYGHNYAPSSYIDAWLEVTQPSQWSAEDTMHLIDHLTE